MEGAMGDDRLVIRTFLEGPEMEVVPVVTYHRDEHARDGTWYKPGGGNLYFANKSFPGVTLKYSNGPIGGAAGGHPVQLIFWGDWWNTGDGKPKLSLIEQRVQGLLASPYFSELAQYGVAHAPIWRGSTVVTRPTPPVRVHSREATRRCLDLVNDMIDNGVFPDPDDGPRIVFIVLMPDGFTLTNPSTAGSHRSDYDWDFLPFDDYFWVGWVRPEPDPEETLVTLSHELVEILTDPERDGWRWDPEPNDYVTEISDGLWSPTGGPTQTAWVGGAHVQAYWSRRHLASLIPLDTDYGAQLRAKIKETSRRVADRGTFRPSAADMAACSRDLPECCIEDRDYEWRSYSIDETAKVRVNKQRYRTLVLAWSINGVPVSGVGEVRTTVEIQSFNGREPVTQAKEVVLQYDATKAEGIDISAKAIGGNFEIQVACTVTEGAITGDNVNNVIAAPAMTVDFLGAEVLIEDAYAAQLSGCLNAMLRQFDQYTPTGRPGPDEPINFLSKILVQELPAYVRPRQYRRIQEAVRQVRAANMLLAPEAAAMFTQSIVDAIPPLKLMAQRHGNVAKSGSAA
jgi:hypothetical protein